MRLKRLTILAIIIFILLVAFIVVKYVFNPFSSIAEPQVGVNTNIGLKISLDNLDIRVSR